jgi:hypothetical protein
MKNITSDTPRTNKASEYVTDLLACSTQLERELNELHDQYRRLHSQVSGYLSGKEWLHWQKYNEPKYAPDAMPNNPQVGYNPDFGIYE